VNKTQPRKYRYEPIQILFQRKYVQPWILSYYLDRFSSLLTRLELCIQISSALGTGVHPQEICIIQRSRNLWDDYQVSTGQQLIESTGGAVADSQEQKVSLLLPVTRNQKLVNKEFFYYLHRVKRPNALILSNGKRTPLFDIYSEDFLVVRSLVFNSPGDMTVDVGSGLAEVIHELRYGHHREKREQKSHEKDMEKKTLETALLEQELLSKTLDNVRKMQDIGLKVVIKSELGKVIQTTIKDIASLNQKTDVILELPEIKEKENL